MKRSLSVKQKMLFGMGTLVVLFTVPEGIFRLLERPAVEVRLPSRQTGVYRILVLGGSTVWGWPVPKYGFVAQLEAGLRYLAAIIHKFGVSVDFLRKFRAESVFRCDYKASKLVEPNRDEARAPSGNSSARRGLYICVGAGSQGTVRWDTDGASVMRRAFVRDKTMPGAPRCDEKFPEPGHRF